MRPAPVSRVTSVVTGLTRIRLAPDVSLPESSSVLPVPAPVQESVLEAIASTVRRGEALSTVERNAVAYLARTPGYWESVNLSDGEVGWVRQLVDDPGGIGPATVPSLFPDGIDDARLVEMLNVAAQVRAVDTYCFAVGMRRLPLSQSPGDHERKLPSSESSLRNSLYVPDEHGDDVSITVAPLSRMDVEYVAALVSYLNESVIDLATHTGLLRLADTEHTLAADGLRLDHFRCGTVAIADAGIIADFVRAGHRRDAHAMVDARVELASRRGPAFAAAVASVHAAFELMNRLTLGVVAGLGSQIDRAQAQTLWRQIAGTTNAPIAHGVVELGFGPHDLALPTPGA